jgi:hypothetical protein
VLICHKQDTDKDEGKAKRKCEGKDEHITISVDCSDISKYPGDTIGECEKDKH